MSDLVLAIDLGTSSAKLLAVDRGGAVVHRRSISYSTRRPSPGAAEQDPGEWWQNIRDGVRDVIGNGHEVAAVGVTGQMHGLVLHDEHGQPLRPAITWQDRRSSLTLPDLQRQLPERSARRIAPGLQAASWHWLTGAASETVAATRRILLPKDAIVFRLTGEHVTDPSDAVGTGWFDPAAGDWDDRVLDACGVERAILPRIVPPGSVAGPLMAAAAAELGLTPGTPVSIAGGDAAVGAFGTGASETAPLLMLSTGCQVLHPTDTCSDEHCWPSATPGGARWLRVTATLNGGNVVRWARETLGDPAMESDPDLVFLPYLAGERSPELAGDAAGAFLALREHHGRQAMSRAVLDGVALGVAAAFERIDGELATGDPILAGGGGIRDTTWLASAALAFGRPLRVMDEPDLSAWGAARSAAAAIGWIDPVRDASAWLPPSHDLMPPTQTASAVRARLARFRALSRRVYGTAR